MGIFLSFPAIGQEADWRETLPDPLRPVEGMTIQSAAEWVEVGRPATLELFREHVYGRAPVGRPPELSFEVTHTDVSAMDGQATLKQVDIRFAGPGGEGAMELVLFIPNDVAWPVPAFVLICHRARSNIDPTRQVKRAFWPAEEIVERGYVAAAFHTAEIAPDSPYSFKDGVIDIFDPLGVPRPPDAWATIAAWAWGAHRALDYFETDPAIDATRSAVVGHSRGGKAALWSGAEDERFALVVSNNSGSTGAALARRRSGETVEDINSKFPHWFCENYKSYNFREDDLPVDQHQLIALMAPRLVYVASASQDSWADPPGEFFSCVYAVPVYELFGLHGLGVNRLPDPDRPVHESRFWGGGIGYHLRSGGHDLTLYDWERYMDFADLHWERDAPGWVDDGTWLGLHYARYAPWVYSASLERWLYVPPSGQSGEGGWIYLAR